ncbi:MAG: M23 family metallopeptidase [Cyclobacteriaceae bacterium]
MRRVYTLILLLSFFNSSGQSDLQGYYMFPINPGQQNYLAGTMGELRSSHFHAGIDVKTGGQIGLPVYAAANGYVWRVRVATGGYGKAIYLRHPNGTTTVYAHLDKFEPKLAQHILETQYKEESFTVQLFPDKTLFPVKKGDIIAYSGNTGSSSGPHLHFEIRDANQNILDPLLYGFDEIVDTQSPLLKRIGFVTLDKEARVNKTFGRYDFEVIKTAKLFTTRTPISLSGKIGVEIYAYDRQDGVWSKNGISEITMKIDGDTVFSQLKSNLSFSKQRNILTHMDYAAYKEKGLKYNKLFVDDGNTHDIYMTPSPGFDFNDSTHLIQIYLKDSYGNISTFETKVNNHKIVYPPNPEIKDFEVFRNFLHFKAEHTGEPNLIQLYLGQAFVELTPYRTDKRNAYYLWDLREGLPDSVNFCGEVMSTGIFAEIPSNTETAFYNHASDLLFDKRSLFDTLYLRFEKSFDTTLQLEIFTFLHPDVPLKSSVEITLKPEESYPDSTAAVYSVYRNRLNYMGGEWSDGSITFKTRDLVSYTISQDTIPPVISPTIINKDNVYFKINDEKSGIKSYRATINGAFVLMNYEPKKKLIWSEKFHKNIPFVGEFVLEVEDNTGNKSTYKKTF